MSNVQGPGSMTCSSRRGPSTGRTHDALLIPNTDDIEELAKQVQEITDIFSRLLLNETKWREGVSLEHRKLLETSMDEFCGFCKDAMALLQNFSRVSQQFSFLLEAMLDQEDFSSMERYARQLRSEVESICTRTSSVEGQYMNFTSRFRELMRIAPTQLRQQRQEDNAVFQRLDAFWKVGATQLSSILDHKSELPDLSIVINARNKWLEYQGCLLGAMDALKLSSDALEASADELRGYHYKSGISLSGYVKIGFTAFWSRLARRRPTLQHTF